MNFSAGDNAVGQRETSMAERRSRMLAAATYLFEMQGFQKTTMDAIAARAGVGVATVYNYFGSKEGVIVEITQPDMDRAFAEAEKIIGSAPDDPRQALTSLIDCYTKIQQNWHNRGILSMTIARGVSGRPSDLDEQVDQVESRVRQQIRDLLRVLQMRGLVPEGANITVMADIVFAVFNQAFIEYVTHDNISARRTFRDIHQRIDTLCRPWWL